MSMHKQKNLVYDDGRTKQSFRDSADINKMLAKAMKTGAISHLEEYEAQYGDFEAFDFFEAQNTLAKANSIFAELPSELRQEFNQSPGQFFSFVNDPDNVGNLGKIFPELAEPGRQLKGLQPTVENPPAEPPVAAEVTPPSVPPLEVGAGAEEGSGV